MKKMLLSFVAGCALLTGCTTNLSVGQRVGIANETYIASVESVTTLSQTDQITLSQLETFEAYRMPVGEYLDVALQDILDGDADGNGQAIGVLDIIEPLIDRMIQAQIEAERDNNDG